MFKICFPRLVDPAWGDVPPVASEGQDTHPEAFADAHTQEEEIHHVHRHPGKHQDED